MRQKQGSVVVLLLLFLVLLLGGALLLFATGFFKSFTSQPKAPVEGNRVVETLSSPAPISTPETTYENPLDDSTQYENPFAEYQNPFDSIGQ